VLRIVIVEDHPLMRESLQARLVSRSEDIRFVYVGDSLDEAIEAIGSERLDCFILDLDLGDGRSVLENLATIASIEAPVLVVSAAATPRAVQVAISHGARGYVSKSSSTEAFMEAFEAVCHGEAYVSPDLAAVLATEAGAGVQLSTQEQRALALYSSGMKIETVARRMDVSTSTAKEYIRRVRAKYAAAGTPLPTKVELYQQAQRDGIL